MGFRKINDAVSVSPQINEADVAAAAAQGFKTIIVNRPDGEEPGQPSYAAIRAAAEKHGLGFYAIPVVASQIGDDSVAQFGQALADLPGPVLAYCRSGTRSTMLWALSQAGRSDVESILKTAAEAGYDLSALAPRLSGR